MSSQENPRLIHARDLFDEHTKKVKTSIDWSQTLEDYVFGTIKARARILVSGREISIPCPNYRHVDWRKDYWEQNIGIIVHTLQSHEYVCRRGRGGELLVHLPKHWFEHSEVNP